MSTRALQAGALIQTSGEDAMLFLAPPLICTERDLELLGGALDDGLGVANQELGPA